MAELGPEFADHVERSVEAIAAVHREHARETTPLQRIVERVTAWAARPAVTLVGAALILAWVAWNGWVAAHGRKPVDPPPFGWLELVVSIAGVGLATLILATQRRENQLDEQRSQLILELALQGDRKTAKLIALLEELRRDAPSIADRHDPESEAMSRPADAGAVLEAIQKRADPNAS